MTNDRHARGLVYILLTAAMWSTMEVVSKTIAHEIAPMQMTFLRFLIGGLVMLPFALQEMSRRRMQVAPADWAAFFKLGLISIVLSMVLLQSAVKYTHASLAALVLSSNPLYAAPLAAVILKEKLNKRTWAALGVGMFGLMIIVNPLAMRLDDSALGVLLALGAALSFAAFTVLGRKVAMRYSSLVMNTFSALMGVAVLGVVLLTTRQPILAGITDQNIWILLYMGIFNSGIAYILYFKGIHYTSVATGGLTFFIKPVFASILAAVVLQETISFNMIMGIGVVLLALLIKFRR